MLDHLAPSAQSVVSMLVELISAHYGSDKGKVTPIVPTRSVKHKLDVDPEK
jgi:hypothetical protein